MHFLVSLGLLGSGTRSNRCLSRSMAEPYWSSESENEEWKSDDGGEEAPSAEEQAATAEGATAYMTMYKV